MARELGFSQVSLSHEVMPMVKMVPRGFTAAADAYLTPHIKRYLADFTGGFDAGLKEVQVCRGQDPPCGSTDTQGLHAFGLPVYKMCAQTPSVLCVLHPEACLPAFLTAAACPQLRPLPATSNCGFESSEPFSSFPLPSPLRTQVLFMQSDGGLAPVDHFSGW